MSQLWRFQSCVLSDSSQMPCPCFFSDWCKNLDGFSAAFPTMPQYNACSTSLVFSALTKPFSYFSVQHMVWIFHQISVIITLLFRDIISTVLHREWEGALGTYAHQLKEVDLSLYAKMWCGVANAQPIILLRNTFPNLLLPVQGALEITVRGVHSNRPKLQIRSSPIPDRAGTRGKGQ